MCLWSSDEPLSVCARMYIPRGYAGLLTKSNVKLAEVVGANFQEKEVAATNPITG